jgi:prephenate dehydratase
MLETPKVAIQGDIGSYSEEAALSMLGREIEVHRCEHFREVFEITSAGQTNCCVVPIENSLAGSIHKNYDLLLRHKLKIVREANLHIQHNLIGVPGVAFEEISTVVSHPVALDQCENLFEKFPRLTRKSAYDTSGSVRRVVEENRRDWAAIASRRAAKHYGGQVLMDNIQDNKKNFTRFFLLSPSAGLLQGANKTSIAFSFKNTPGGLLKSLSVFALRDIDLTKIESRPIHGRPWEYLFYVDLLGSVEEEKVESALNHLREIAEFLEVLGCYPCAKN